MKTLTVLFALMLVGMPVQALKLLGPYTGEVVYIVDGDTFDAVTEVYPGTRMVVRYRIYGINTPELRTKQPCEYEAAVAAKAYLEELIEAAPYGRYGYQVQLLSVRTCPFNRPCASVQVNGEFVSTKLLEAGHAVVVKGRGRMPAWVCY